MTSIKMDELMVTWVTSDGVYESILNMIEEEKKRNGRSSSSASNGNTNNGSSRGLIQQTSSFDDGGAGANPNGVVSSQTDSSSSPSPSSDRKQRPPQSPRRLDRRVSSDSVKSSDASTGSTSEDGSSGGAGGENHGTNSSTPVDIPPLLLSSSHHRKKSINSGLNNGINDISNTDQSWEHVCQTNATLQKLFGVNGAAAAAESTQTEGEQQDHTMSSSSEHIKLSRADFMDITKEVCRFPSFFNGPLFSRITSTFEGKENHDNNSNNGIQQEVTKNDAVSLDGFKKFWISEMEPYDEQERFFRLVKKPSENSISRDDFLPFIEELLATHPGLEFLSNHAEFQEKYAVTVITRIFYTVQRHGGGQTGKITLRQIRKSNLLEAMYLVDTEEDINKVTQYFSYEHFYVLYCRFWELDHDRDYLITREDLLKYGDHSLSHLIVDRIFDAAPRPFETSSIATANAAQTAGAATANNDGTAGDGSSDKASPTNTKSKDYLSYEDFIFFMLSEEDKANEISVRYWFTCIDVDGDGRLNNMEMRSFYAVQLHRMQCLGHEIVPFEDMLCQMMDMIKPKNPDYLVIEDFLQPECAPVSGSLFDALFNLNKYLQFEQRDPFMERQKREDEFECDWDRFACIDYNRLAMEEEAREEEAMEIDWVTVDEDDDDGDDFNALGLGATSESPF